jgi:cysteine desulfurase
VTIILTIVFTTFQIYGPKGVGALYIRRRPRVRLEPLFSGGGQERGLRSGTLSPPLCVGMGAAARICVEDLEHDTKWIEYLSEKFKK